MNRGFVASAIIYTILLLFLILMSGILSNLQSKKDILDALKTDTIRELQQNND